MPQFIDIENIRKDFPILESGNSPIYFDNACVSLRPRQVINEIRKYYEFYPACAGRSSHRLADLVSQKYGEARRIVADFIGAKMPEEIIFLRNATEGINLVAKSFNFQKGDIVLTTNKEHNSNLLPWLWLKKEKGVLPRFIPSKENNTFDLEAFRETMKGLKGKVRLVSMVLTSNLDGVTTPAKEIIKIAHKNGSLVLLDGAQAIGHKPVDVQELDCDFLAFSGHKMCGPSGIGALYGKYRLLEKLPPFLLGGDTVKDSSYESFEMLSPPEKFEAGLQNYAGALGLAVACQYLKNIGLENIEKHLTKLNRFVSEKLLANKKIELIGPKDPEMRSGIFSFNIKGINFHEVALMLDNMSNIAVRSGQHCVHSWFNARQIKGSARASFYFYNTVEECRIFIAAVRKILTLT
jgi:cysteine desulfurase/selenocysteine lyase